MSSKILSNVLTLYQIIQTNLKLYAKLYLTRQTPVIIYQMGKVGSTSINSSLRKAGVVPVFQVHYFIRKTENRHFFDIQSPQLESVKKSKMVGLIVGKFLYDNLILKRKPVKIISLTREPIGRNISGFFENFERETGEKYENSSLTPDELTKIFLNFYPHSIPLNWFDDQVKSYLGIDVYQYPFPQDAGYLVIRQNNIELLLLKSELSDAIKEKLIAEFLELKEFTIINKNVGSNKKYRNAYQLFKKSLKLPISYVEEMCESRYFNHFYTQDEIQQVKSNWSDIDIPR